MGAARFAVRTIVRFSAAASLALLAMACSDGGGSPAPPPFAPAPAPPPPAPGGGSVQISGVITYDFVPAFSGAGLGLNYGAITQRPARGVVVDALSAGGGVLATTITDASGAYTLTVDANTDVRIRAQARLRRTDGASWDIAARDNTNGDALYTLAGALASSGAANSTRNLNAPSGWTGASYGATRAAAPFAALDAIYDALVAIAAAAPGVSVTPGQVFWSVSNRAIKGSIAAGEITTTSYTRINGVPTMLLLGAENADTDEYDGAVVVHEFGHYFEDVLSRSDSLGGEHSLSDRLDPRVAWSEGFANAFAGMIRNDPIYRDTFGPQQSQGFTINVEGNTGPNLGWFSERSTQSVAYDVFDVAADGVDTIAAGFPPIYQALVSPAFAQSTAPATIFTAEAALRAQPAVPGAGLDALLNAQSIFGRTPIAAGETNNGGIATSLPVLRPVTPGGGAISICSVDDAGTYNKLGNRTLMRLSLAAAQTLTFTMSRTSGPTNRDPDFIIYNRGQQVAAAESSAADSETLTRLLAAGDYFIDAYDFRNTDDAGPSGDVCFSFSVN